MFLKYGIALMLCLSVVSLRSSAQPAKTFDPGMLAVRFKITDNNYQNQGRAKATLTLTNKGSEAFPSSGWVIYFNNKAMIAEHDSSTAIRIIKKQGNLFSIEPANGFQPIRPKDSLSFELDIENNLLNKNDLPEGFYIVRASSPGKGYSLTNLSFDVNAADHSGYPSSDFAAEVFERNKTIDTAVGAISPIFPSPANIRLTDAKFPVQNLSGINTDPEFIDEAETLSTDIFKIGNKKVPIASAETAFQVGLLKDISLSAGAYRLSVSSNHVKIYASDRDGIFYGIQSFEQLLYGDGFKGNKFSGTLRGLEVADSARFRYRGFMLDVARDFQTKKEVIRILDLMALYKLNYFHFHLTDDEGWRLEIPGLPELTSIGSNRGFTTDESANLPSAYGSGPDTAALYGSGHYSREDFIEILEYANSKHITVIPEIESPGHARAAITAMNARYVHYMKEGNQAEALRYFLRDTLDKSEYSTPQWFHDNVMNVSLPSVYTFIDKVASEIQLMYKDAGLQLTRLHIGGDEVPAGVWEKSPEISALMKKDPLVRDINGLWYYYIDRVHSILSKKNISMAGWEEIGLRKTILDGKKITIPNPDFVNKDLQLYVWNNTEGNEDLAYRLANAGYPVVISFVSNFYFDMMQYKTFQEPGYYWGGITDLEKTYRFIPYDYLKNAGAFTSLRNAGQQRLSEYGKEHIIGLQGAVWSETLKGPQQLEYMLLPRLTALAERAWASAPVWETAEDSASFTTEYRKSWSLFAAQESRYNMPLLDKLNGGYNYRVPPVGAVKTDGAVSANVQMPGFSIRYTTDGSEPTGKSKIYNSPGVVKKLIKLKAFTAGGRSGITTVVDNSQ